MNRITVTPTSSAKVSHASLAALGHALQRAHILDSLYDVAFPIKTIDYCPGDKLIEALVLVPAGERATSQIDLLLRPDLALALPVASLNLRNNWPDRMRWMLSPPISSPVCGRPLKSSCTSAP